MRKFDGNSAGREELEEEFENADVPLPPRRRARGTEEVPEAPNRDEIQPDDDVRSDAGTVEPPD